MSTVSSDLLLEVRAGVAWITFNRPHKANALTPAMLQGVEQALTEYATNDGVRAVVLTGAGPRSFSAGADMTPAPENTEIHRAQRRAQFAATLLALADFEKPSVAAVNGAACGAGMMLALLCDVTIGAKAARFSLPEINRGMPTLPGIAIVGHRFGAALAADLVLSGRFIEADEAARRGLVAELTAGDELAGRAQNQALALSGNNPQAYAQNKRWLNRTLRKELAEAGAASAKFHEAHSSFTDTE